jgi:hypothetical protein
MDQTLLNLMEAAEGGFAVPRIYLWTGGLVVTGLPISAEECQECLGNSILALKPKEKEDLWSGTRKRVSPEVEARFDEEIRSLGDSLPDPKVLHLGDANVFTPASGETVSIAALRVSVPTINAWFVGQYRSKEKGSSFFVGGLLPFDF